jgi:hypothetical protein
VRVGRDASGNLVDPSRFAPVYGEDRSLARVRVKRGAGFTTGDVIGTVNAFNHVHLNVGWTAEERNPLLFRWPGTRDTVPPTIPRNGIRLYDESGNAFDRRRRNRLLVHGRVRITVEAWDRMNDSPKRRRLGVYRIGYEILRANGSRAGGAAAPSPSENTIEFDRLALDPDAPRTVYAQGSGIPFYGNRVTRFLYNVTNSFRDGVVKVGAWDTTMLAPGDYVVRVTVVDAAGNEARINTDVPVTVLPAAAQR